MFWKKKTIRIIPAWAGNTLSRPAISSSGSGSSPRGRGTRSERRGGDGGRRIIPAWAGNTPETHRFDKPKTDHPRVGGEHNRRVWPSPLAAGSSPRGRGTLNQAHRASYKRRIIPAWAGNTPCQTKKRSGATDHPRVGGEHPIDDPLIIPPTGSSPRGRGTLLISVLDRFGIRIIPAWAGNTPVAT